MENMRGTVEDLVYSKPALEQTVGYRAKHCRSVRAMTQAKAAAEISQTEPIPTRAAPQIRKSFFRKIFGN
jgi:hypothetical protein